MTTRDTSWNPTAAAAAANEGQGWPSSPPVSCGGGFDSFRDQGRIHLGGQAPMFIHTDVADAGLVRLGGQSPLFRT